MTPWWIPWIIIASWLGMVVLGVALLFPVGCDMRVRLLIGVMALSLIIRLASGYLPNRTQ